MTSQEFTIDFEAIGTQWFITTTKPLAQPVATAINERVRSFEQDYSRFRPESILSRLNNEKLVKNPPKELIDMLRFSIDLFDATDGVFNISVGGLLEQQGYGKHADGQAKLSVDLASDIQLSEDQITIASHVRLDFGGFGKGWLVDSLHKTLNEAGYSEHIINGGGDIMVGDKPERLYIQNPVDPSEVIASIVLRNDALAVSSHLQRQWKNKTGETVHHIIGADIARAVDRSSLIQLTVRASSCLLADSAATILYAVTDVKGIVMAEQLQVEFMRIDEKLQKRASANFFSQNSVGV